VGGAYEEVCDGFAEEARPKPVEEIIFFAD
jgi:hypothetical protein